MARGVLFRSVPAPQVGQASTSKGAVNLAKRMAEHESDNANIREQHKDWQEQRRSNNQDPNDWSAFREHMKGIGAPDPGEEEAEDFKMEKETMQEAKSA